MIKLGLDLSLSGLSSQANLPSMYLGLADVETLDSRITFTRASSKTYFNSSGTLATAATNEAPREYDPVTLACRGRSFWEARTNLFTYSEQFDNAIRGKVNSSITVNAAVAPDANLTADKFVEDSTTNVHYFSYTISITAGTVYTRSLFVEAAERTKITLQADTTMYGGVENKVRFDLSAVTATTLTGTATGTISPQGNGWYRIAITFPAASATGANGFQFRLNDSSGAQSYLGDGTSGVYVWGDQFEVGSTPSPYIPTTTAAVTRAADVCSMTGTNFSNWYNQTEGTFLVSAMVSATTTDSTARVVLAAGDSATFNESIYLARDASSANITANIIDGGVAQWASNTLGTCSANSFFSTAVAYKLNDCAGSLGGGAINSDASASLPTVNSLGIGKASWTGANYINGWISSIAYWNRRLPNDYLRALSGS